MFGIAKVLYSPPFGKKYALSGKKYLFKEIMAVKRVTYQNNPNFDHILISYKF